MASTSIKDYILYYKTKLDRIKDNEDMILETIHKLSKPTVTADIIQETGILKYLFKLTRRKGRVADTAFPLFNKWKLLVNIAMKEKDNLRKASPVEERVNHSVAAKPRAREIEQPAPGDHAAPDKALVNHMFPRTTDREMIKRKGPTPPSADPKRQTHHPHRDKDTRHYTPQKDPDPKPSRSTIPPHRSSDSDSDRGSRHQSAKRDHIPSKMDSSDTNPKYPSVKKDLFGSEMLSHRGKDGSYKSRKDCSVSETGRDGNNKSFKEYFFSDWNPSQGGSLSHHGSSKYPSGQRDVYAPETEVSHSGASHKDSDFRYSAPKKDYFAPETDMTGPSSKSDQNGVTECQESNHLDIDSLSNPNLNIDTSQAEKLNSSSEDGDHASPTKRAKTLEPYYIEMREGMFRAVKNPASPNCVKGLRVCELIHREIIKGNTTYKREQEKFEEQKKNDASLPSVMSPKGNSGAAPDKHPSGNGPWEPYPNFDKASWNCPPVPSSHDLKRKPSSPCKGGEKRLRPDSTSEHKLKVKKEVQIKKEVQSPSHLSKPQNNVEAAHQSNCDRNKKIQDSPDAPTYISSKKERRAVYSGKKSVQEISTLKSCCLRVLRKNLDYLRCPMEVPYEMLHPILETLNPAQLSKIEEHNKYLLTHTNSIWKQLYNRDYRGMMVGRNERDVIWKDEYNRAYEQQRKKLKNLTASINASASKTKPDRQAKLTIVDSHHDPLRKRARTPEVPVISSKSSASSAAPKSASPAISSKLSASPTPKPSSSVPREVLPIISKPKEQPKHFRNRPPVKKVVAPLMSKVKKSMAIVYRQK